MSLSVLRQRSAACAAETLGPSHCYLLRGQAALLNVLVKRTGSLLVPPLKLAFEHILHPRELESMPRPNPNSASNGLPATDKADVDASTRANLFKLVEKCASQADKLTKKETYALCWHAVMLDCLSRRFTTQEGIEWVRGKIEELLEDLRGRRDRHNTGTREQVKRPEATVYPVCSVLFKSSCADRNACLL